MSAMGITVFHTVEEDVILSLLATALEQGSTYWIRRFEYDLHDGVSLEDFRDGGKRQRDTYWHPAQLIPMEEGCALIIVDDVAHEEGNPNSHRLGRDEIRKGLSAMAKKFPRHLSDALTGNGDAETADVFLQCSLFGDVIYG